LGSNAPFAGAIDFGDMGRQSGGSIVASRFMQMMRQRGTQWYRSGPDRKACAVADGEIGAERRK